MRAKFEDNPIMHCVLWKFLQVCKKKKKERKKKTQENEQLFVKAYISGTAGAIYFRSSICSLSICRHLHSKFGLVWSRDHRATNAHKIALCSSY